MPSCNCCYAYFSSEKGLNTHVSTIAACREHAMLTPGRLLHQPPKDLNAAFYSRIPSLSIGRTGGSGSVLPALGVPNLFPQLLPPGRRDTHDGSEEDGTTVLLDNDSLDEGDCFSVQSMVRKEAESGAPVQEDNSIGSSITPINWPSGFQNGGGAGTDHDDYYGNTPVHTSFIMVDVLTK